MLDTPGSNSVTYVLRISVGFLEAVFMCVLFHSIPGGLIGSVASIFCTPTLLIRSFSFLPSKDLIFLS